MPVDIEYNFKTPESSDENKDVRKNLRVTRCCSNCSYFVPGFRTRGYGVGFCKYPDQGTKVLKQKYGGYKEAVPNLFKTHRTCLCDFYKLRAKRTSIDAVGKIIGKKFLNDGTLQNE